MKDTNQRLFLAIALWLAVIFGYMTFFGPKKGAQPQKPPASAAPAAAAAPAVAVAAPSPAPGADSAATAKVQAAKLPEQRVVFETPRAHVVATSNGAALSSIVLKGEKFTRHKGTREESQVELAEARAGEPLPFSTVLKGKGGAELVAADASYEVVSQDASKAVFRLTAGDVTVTKTFTVNPATYGVELAVDVRSTTPLAGELAVLFGGHAEEPKGGLFSSRSNVPGRTLCETGGKSERVAVGAKTPLFESVKEVAFAGLDEQYFLTAALPPQGVAASCRLEAITVAGQKDGSLRAALIVPVSGTQASLVFAGYAGPKDTDELSAVSRTLRQAVDFGFWSVIAELLLAVMKFFQKVVPPHNWGIAIILLTLAMKALTFPLQHKSMKSMQEMQRIQPQLEEMKKKYAGDTQRQNLEQMKLFKEHGVNPMGSCLPMVIQMPIWFALYTTLQVSVELYNSAFIPGWINDLTAPDPIYVLPVAMGITMVLTQVLTPTPMSNPSQKTMGYVMSGFFSLLMLTLPSGLTLYIFVNNVLSIIQQMYLRRTMRPPPAGGQTVVVPA